jgi:hypothetical protein
MNPKRDRKRLIRRIAIWLVIFQIAIFPLGTTVAISRTTDPHFDDPSASHLRSDVLKILSVLENKIEDQQLLGKTKEKLLSLSDRETRLIASLADRVTQGGNTTGSNVAFLLMTALITLL